MTSDDFEAAVATVQSPLPPDQRQDAFDRLQLEAFQSAGSGFSRDRYLALLRDLLDDSDLDLRNAAIDALAMEKDQGVQERLLNELPMGFGGPVAAALLAGAPSRPLVTSVAKALELLSYDGHGPHVPVSRELIESRELDDVTRIEAARVLASDASSEDVLARITSDRDEPSAIRVRAGVSLRALAPPRFAEVARAILADLTEDPDLRAMCEVAFRTSRTLRRLG
jgi:hypothetical protein